MKHVSKFDDFLRDTVNLNKSRIDTLESRVETISNFLLGCEYDAAIIEFTPQGSWAHKTIIKPPGKKGFDADLLVLVEENDEWEPEDYVNKLYKSFRSSDVYKEKVSRESRCVKVDYAGDFHLDAVPVIKTTGYNGDRFHVCNRVSNEFEETNSEKYTEWLSERNDWAGSNQLQKVIRLLKYLRDIKGTFSVKSILLTTLVGERINYIDDLLANGSFSDVPTSLKTLVGRLDDWLQSRPALPTIDNPVLLGENFNRHWDQAKYDNFRDKINQYRTWIDEAYSEEDRQESITKWRKVFGEEFAKGVVFTESKNNALSDLFSFTDNWIEQISSKGRSILKQFPLNWAHVEEPKWAITQRVLVEVRMALAEDQSDPSPIPKSSGDIVPTNRWLKFTAHVPSGLPTGFTVWWRIVNTGGVAASRDCLRGGFYPSEARVNRWEQTSYRGVHWVEAYVVNAREQCVGKSKPFFVTIE